MRLRLAMHCPTADATPAFRVPTEVQHVAACRSVCSVLQCVAACCSVLQCVTVCVAVWCSVVQCGAVCSVYIADSICRMQRRLLARSLSLAHTLSFAPSLLILFFTQHINAHTYTHTLSLCLSLTRTHLPTHSLSLSLYGFRSRTHLHTPTGPCTSCDAGKYTNVPGVSVCSDCATGSYSSGDHLECVSWAIIYECVSSSRVCLMSRQFNLASAKISLDLHVYPWLFGLKW